MVFLDLNCILLLREFEVLDIFGPALIRRHGPHDPTNQPSIPATPISPTQITHCTHSVRNPDQHDIGRRRIYSPSAAASSGCLGSVQPAPLRDRHSGCFRISRFLRELALSSCSSRYHDATFSIHRPPTKHLVAYQRQPSSSHRIHSLFFTKIFTTSRRLALCCALRESGQVANLDRSLIRKAISFWRKAATF
jgi:hypothetical protein